MKIKCKLIIYLSIICLFFTGHIAFTAEQRIEDIKVKITSESKIPVPIRERMEKSISAIAEQLLQEKKIIEIRKNSDVYENIIYNVFDKILVGYTIQQVELTCDSQADVNIKLIPWNDIIRQIDVDIAVEGMPPFITDLVLKDADGIKWVFEEILIGLPIGSIDWSNGVMKKKVTAFMTDNLPEFRADFDIVEVDENTRIKLLLYPVLPVVRTLDLEMRSDTFPNFLLLTTREKMQKDANDLIGVPVAFVERHKLDIADYYSNSLDKLDDFQKLHIKTNTKMNISENMTLSTRSNLEKLRIRAESWSDIGRQQFADSSMHKARLYMGWHPDSKDDFYVVEEFWLDNPKWKTYAGYKREVVPALHLGWQYDFSSHNFGTEIDYDINKKIVLSHEYINSDFKSELGVKYKLHDYLSLKLIWDRNSTWLRFIGII